MSDVPSPPNGDEIPATAGRRPTKLPWEDALFEAVRKNEQRLHELEREKTELVLENHRLRRALRICRERLENWKLRQNAWRRERDQLLNQLRSLQ